MRAAYVLAFAGFVDGLITRIGAVHQVRTRAQLQGLAAGQEVFQGRGVRRFQFERLLAALEVEQIVA